ncbi:MAG: metallophosphoesterase [Planctomycetota bacterium]|nr:metallophosphoesterase [Planctomycetota bacterium]
MCRDIGRLVLVVVTLALPACGVFGPKAGAAEPQNLLKDAAWEFCIDGGRTFTQQLPTIGPGKTVLVMVRGTFTVSEQSIFANDDELPYAVLELTHGIDPRQTMSFALNGRRIDPPLKGMRYQTIPAIDARRLKRGKNVLTADVAVKNRRDKPIKFAPEMSLVPLDSSRLAFQTAPVFGAFDKDYFSITCRTNMPATVGIYRGGQAGGSAVAASGPGLIHRLRISRGPDAAAQDYSLTAERDGYKVGLVFRPPVPAKGKVVFAACGDSRTHVRDWQKVAAAMAKARPGLVVFSGDMVTSGRDDWLWDEQFFGPAGEFFAAVPFYAVIGNHEGNAPLFDEIFYTPSADGRSRNWVQTIGGALLIGIDGDQDFAAGSDNARWLEQTLSQSGARFIFLFTHYPAWSSGGHGRLDADGKPVEKPVRQSREIIMPLLVKYKATAMIAGHDHFYERSAPPGGVTMIISGGAGAPLYKKAADAEKQNPYSKVFASKLHYCLFEAAGETCTMKAVTPEGKVIDSMTWQGRDVK